MIHKYPYINKKKRENERVCVRERSNT